MTSSSPNKSFHPVPYEIVVAATWWKQAVLKHKDMTASKADKFYDSMITLLSERLFSHWYPEEPLKGQAYRSISFDTMNGVDSILTKAYSNAQIPLASLRTLFPAKVEHVIMWINPGEVVIKVYSNSPRTSKEEILYERTYNSFDIPKPELIFLDPENPIYQRMLQVSVQS